jgi:AbrB family looped-hinge helix DNA binding protein
MSQLISMVTTEQPVKPIVQAKTALAANGRIVIPSAIREELGFKPGETLLMDVDDGALRIESYPARIRRIQREIAQYIPAGRSLVDELIAERREEVRREEEKDLANDIEVGRTPAPKVSFPG